MMSNIADGFTAEYLPTRDIRVTSEWGDFDVNMEADTALYYLIAGMMEEFDE